jgi:ribulose-phosphate 3-epimerase
MALINKVKKWFIPKPKKQKPKFIPIAPSTLCFNMASPETYKLFESGGISTIHVDIMDGFYVEKIAGGINELKTIRANTKSHLHVHLMTENPGIWAANAIKAGADTIILSCDTNGVTAALRGIRSTGRRAGIAINPDTPMSTMVKYLKEVDEFLIMGVKPGAAGQTFNPSVLQKILALSTTRKKHGFKYIISVDGGINPDTAQKCWNAGADLLVSGSYLAKSPDFPLAVQSLLKK